MKYFFLSVLIFTLLSCSAQRSAEGSFHALSVKDLDKAITWYTENLGFTLDSQAENDQRKGALLSKPGVLLELAEFGSAKSREQLAPELASHEVHGIFKIGFIVQDLESEFKRLEAAEVDIFFPIVEATDGWRTFGIKDMEGNIVQYFEQN